MTTRSLVLDRVLASSTEFVDVTRRWSFVRLVDMLLEWHERARQRQALTMLSEHMLKDIGISRADAEREANKPFWCP